MAYFVLVLNSNIGIPLSPQGSNPCLCFMYMKILLSAMIFLWLSSLSHLHAQKEDNVWLLGGNYGSPDTAYRACKIEFMNDSPTVTFINKDLPYDATNTIICDSMGSLACFANGENLYNRDFEIMDGGENFYPNSVYEGGVPYLQGYLLLPLPGSNNKVVMRIMG